ncbi:hypothetical protein W822_05635 [Advenella kashmirensis W13003]|uniref:Uncharacterized protein n=1 Tax=Advenella kashmirensis W13003 TaxID=1424334 RepID=V8QUK7_9BURK|nr:hypothetical protein W822_05635 [Advenella kashmirensis W13003]
MLHINIYNSGQLRMEEKYKDAHIRILNRTLFKYKSARKAGDHVRASGYMLQVKELIHNLRMLNSND